MNKVQQYMDSLYYQNIETQSNIYQINIKPLIEENKSISSIFIKDNNFIETINNITDSDVKDSDVKDSDTKYSDEYIYRKTWSKLNSIHKIIKIKEFINNLSTDNKVKDNLKKQFIQLIKDKKITKKNDINYDMTNGIILSIPMLQYKDNKYIINI